MNSISLVMLVLNEAEFIADSLRSVLPYVNQAIVIDQGSTDGTLDILKQFPSVEVIQTHDNFLTKGEKYFRDAAVQMCNSDWLMIIDADEILSDGWFDEVETFLRIRGRDVGMVLIDYWQLVGSADFHTPDSPLPNERPFLIRKHDRLVASESGNGTKCHCSYRPKINPQVVGRLTSGAMCLHLGYAKTDLTARFERNIERGDWTQSESKKLQYLKMAVENPLQFLPSCIPSRIEKATLPACLRESKWKCDYDPVAKRITGRTAIP